MMNAIRTLKTNRTLGVLLGALLVSIWGEVRAAEKPKVKTGLEELKLVEGNEKENDLRALQAEVLISTSEKKAVQQIQKLLRKYKGSPIEPDLHFRLAELYMRRSKTDRFLELNRQSDTVVKAAPALVKKASSKKFITQAIDIYEKIERRFPRYRKMDLVIFNNGFARQQLGQQKEAEKKYWTIVKDHSYSPLVADCHLAIGEINFDRQKFKFALDHFNAIKKYPQSRVYPYGLYKAAWSYYNLHQPMDGLKELEAVVEYGRYVEQNNIDARLDLRKEALLDMTIFYEDVLPAKQAFSYFQSQAGQLDVAPIILRLATLYDRHSRYSDRRIVLEDFIDNRPKSASVPEIHEELIWNYEKMKDQKLAVRQMEKLGEVCQKGSRWLDSQPEKIIDENGQPTKDTPMGLCAGRVSGTSLKLATKWLKIYKKNPNGPEFADVAEDAFRIHLRYDDNSKEAHEARFVYAELLFQRKKYRMASEQYWHVGQHTKEEKLGHDSRYGAIVSLEKAVNDKWNGEDEVLFKKFAKKYIDSHPKGDYRLDVEFKMGIIAYEKARYDEAAPIFVSIGDMFAKTEKGMKAQDLYLDILNLKKDYEGLKNYSKKLMGAKLAQDRITKLRKIYEQSYFLQAQQLEESGNLKMAMSQYKDFAQENPKSTLAEKAYWNALQIHFQLEDFWGGADAAVRFAEQFPESKQAKDALVKAAETYETMGELSRGVKVIKVLAAKDSENAGKWLSLAADYLLVEGDTDGAMALFEKVASLKGEHAAHALAKVEELSLAKGNVRAHQQSLENLIALGVQPQASLAQLKILEKVFAEKQYTDAFAMAKKVLNMDGTASTYAKAQARMMQAQILEQEFDKQSLKSKAERVHLVLALKTEKLEKAQTAYQAVIRYGDPGSSVEALRRLAHLYGSYVTAIRTMPLPEGVPQEEETAFRAEIDNLAIPMEEKSVQTMAQALNEARRLQLHDGTVPKIQGELDQLNMRPKKESLVKFSQPGIVVPVFKEAVGS
ncbi:MAG: hypothetical protein H6626_08900 [Pseudobdellovibrionaceae bacterium]|nr:hypothetical protein [Bdellovibrionales bacterium]USN46334.1 MAG: hypothetical protein H6626_08900 [Pseudobdellovibrionaceae bacterium]